MPNYRRIHIPGATWFFTINLLERRTTLLTDNAVALRHAIYWTKRRHPFRIDALVVLPDHMHALFTLPPDDTDYAIRIRLMKWRFCKGLPRSEWRSAVRERRRERAIWQRRFWEHHIRSQRDFNAHLDYCYYNPIKHGLVEHIRDWPHSTYHRDVRLDRYPRDWTPEDVKKAMTTGKVP